MSLPFISLIVLSVGGFSAWEGGTGPGHKLEGLITALAREQKVKGQKEGDGKRWGRGGGWTSGPDWKQLWKKSEGGKPWWRLTSAELQHTWRYCSSLQRFHGKFHSDFYPRNSLAPSKNWKVSLYYAFTSKLFHFQSRQWVISFMNFTDRSSSKKRKNTLFIHLLTVPDWTFCLSVFLSQFQVLYAEGGVLHIQNKVKRFTFLTREDSLETNLRICQLTVSCSIGSEILWVQKGNFEPDFWSGKEC